MPERRLVAGTEIVVQQRKLLRQRVVVRRDIASEFHERRIAVPLRHVSEHLVVGAVFLDDVEHVLDRRALPEMHGDRIVRRSMPILVVVTVDRLDPGHSIAIGRRGSIVVTWRQHVVVRREPAS